MKINKLLLGTAKSKSAGKKMMPQADGYKLECAYMSTVHETSLQGYMRYTGTSYIIEHMPKWSRRS